VGPVRRRQLTGNRDPRWLDHLRETTSGLPQEPYQDCVKDGVRPKHPGRFKRVAAGKKINQIEADQGRDEHRYIHQSCDGSSSLSPATRAIVIQWPTRLTAFPSQILGSTTEGTGPKSLHGPSATLLCVRRVVENTYAPIQPAFDRDGDQCGGSTGLSRARFRQPTIEIWPTITEESPCRSMSIQEFEIELCDNHALIVAPKFRGDVTPMITDEA